MKTRYDAEQLAKSNSPRERGISGAIRRLIIRSTKRVLWQLEGHRLGSTTESVEAETFTGIGFHARPRTTSRAEAVLVAIGDAGHAVIVATRDEDLRKLWKAELDADPDVAAMFNSTTIVLVKPDGTVEIRSLGGTAEPLAKASELQALASDFYSHIHAASGSPTTAPIAAFSLPDPPGAPLADPGQPGTDVLKGE